jgi:hypothetical protein
VRGDASALCVLTNGPDDQLLYGYGVDNLEDDRAVIMIRSVGDGDIEPHLIPPVKSHVRADVQFTGYMPCAHHTHALHTHKHARTQARADSLSLDRAHPSSE